MKEHIKKILLWSQKHTKADMLYLAREGFWLSTGHAVNGLLTFGLLIACANILSKETYGVYRYILSIGTMFTALTLTGMNSAVTRAVAAGRTGVLRESVKYQLKWNILMFLGFMILAAYYFLNENTTYAAAFLILGVFTPPTLALNTYTAFLVGKKEFKLSNVLSVISTFIYVCGVLVAIFLGGEITWLIAAYAGTIFFSTLFFYLLVIKKYEPDKNLSSNNLETLKYGRQLSFIAFIGPITSQIDKIVLAHFWGPAQLATYSLAMALPSKVVPMLKKFINLGSPKFATKTPAELNTVFFRRIFFGMFVGGIATISYILVAPYVFRYLLPQYTDGILYSQILAISFIFAMPTRYIGQLFESQRMSSHIFLNTIINSMVGILLYVSLGILGGTMGLVIAYVLWSSIGMLVNMISWRLSGGPSTKKYK